MTGSAEICTAGGKTGKNLDEQWKKGTDGPTDKTECGGDKGRGEHNRQDNQEQYKKRLVRTCMLAINATSPSKVCRPDTRSKDRRTE